MERARPAVEIFSQNLGKLLEGKVKAKIARTAEMSARTLQKHERCQAAAQIDTVDALARALRVPAWQLLVPNMDASVNHAELARLVQNYLAATPKGRSFMAEVCANSVALQKSSTALSADIDD